MAHDRPDEITGNVAITQGMATVIRPLCGTNIGGSIAINQSVWRPALDTATRQTDHRRQYQHQPRRAAGNGAIDSQHHRRGANDGAKITISISQGNGNGDTATILNITASGGTRPTRYLLHHSGLWERRCRGDREREHPTAMSPSPRPTGQMLRDTAYVLNVTTGTSSGSDDFNGTVTIMQGNAPGDVALVQDGSSNNIAITQGDNINPTPDGSTTLPISPRSIAPVSSVTSRSSRALATVHIGNAGNYVAAVAFDYLGLLGENPVGYNYGASGWW